MLQNSAPLPLSCWPEITVVKGGVLTVANTPGTQVYAVNLKAFLGQVMPGMTVLPGFNSPACVQLLLKVQQGGPCP